MKSLALILYTKKNSEAVRNPSLYQEKRRVIFAEMGSLWKLVMIS